MGGFSAEKVISLKSGKVALNFLDKDKYNAPNLKKLLADQTVKKIFHYARADLLFIKKYLDISFSV